MSSNKNPRIAEILERHEAALLADWLAAQKASPTYRPDLIKEGELRDQSREFLRLLTKAVASGGTDVEGSEWQDVRDLLSTVSQSRGQKGFSPSATAMFVFSFKEPLFTYIRKEFATDAHGMADETWTANVLLDHLGLYTTEIYQQTRESVILRQQQEMLELSTPVVKMWDGILALPLIGTLDSGRTQTVMENLLQRIVETGSETAIIDITGVPTVDTLTAQHLLKTVAAARLMGVDCIISGIRPQIAQTIVHLGIDLSAVTTKANLADAFALSLKRLGLTVVRQTSGR
ncbi:STAS domain-containing protein [Fimbriiglobus ruber]|uniref:RsbR, positive regulator of sigma-B n=1 Tax=Fimbriiglobus ruber TaxID=1908690 RepID=A0A225E2I6_9BACT|nr:STAS domain-containing protein [Fimbriiglobus ruber]OWK44286.1 RsbR, positive regulator of sigma-B [Fimbriiglobus ruber]